MDVRETVGGFGDGAKHCAVVGPPGTGKTSYVARQVERAVERHGEDRVVVCSLTRAAAAEAAGRVRLPREQVGTLHALCYRALGHPTIANSKIAEWNASPIGARWRISPDSFDAESAPDERKHEHPGDEMLEQYSMLRLGLVPEDRWPVSVRGFAAQWQAFKDDLGALDFSDLILRALEDVPSAPGGRRGAVASAVRVIFVDEAQDLSPAEVKLCQAWGQRADTVVMVGDPDQALYTWRGADANAFLPVDRSNIIALKQSYRVPQAVRDLALRWISRVRDRFPVEYLPRDPGHPDPGELRLFGPSLRHGRELVAAIRDDLDRGMTVMVQASCAYMLRMRGGVLEALRDAALPFHNPWRARSGEWNPLARGTEKRHTAVDRLLAWLRHGEERVWTAAEVRLWAEHLRAEGVFERGGKTAVQGLDPDAELDPADLFEAMRGWFRPEALARIDDEDLGWWLASLAPPKQRSAAFPARVLEARGVAALRDPPRVIVGTIHSLKGSEADSVYVFPDISYAAHASKRGAPVSDDVVRQFYVAITRARRKLTICNPATALHEVIR